MIVLVTDFGLEGPYIGQMQRVFLEHVANTPVVNLFADAPACNPKATAYLLGAYSQGFPTGTVFLCVVDPAVGSGQHAPVAVNCDGCWYVGPDNGLFEIVRRRARSSQTFRIRWRPPRLSASFHGRDLYAPTAARLAKGELSGQEHVEPQQFPDWPDDLPEVIYIDHYGNAITGLRASTMTAGADVIVASSRLRLARTFADVGHGEAFWYENSNGLVEIAVNQGRADTTLGLRIGTAVTFE